MFALLWIFEIQTKIRLIKSNGEPTFIPTIILLILYTYRAVLRFDLFTAVLQVLDFEHPHPVLVDPVIRNNIFGGIHAANNSFMNFVIDVVW